MFKKMIIVGVLFGLIGCASPVKHLRDVSSYAKCRDRSYKIKSILWEIQNASFIGETEIKRPFVSPASEIQQIADEIRDIDRKFKCKVIQDSAYTILVVGWK